MAQSHKSSLPSFWQLQFLTLLQPKSQQIYWPRLRNYQFELSHFFEPKIQSNSFSIKFSIESQHLHVNRFVFSRSSHIILNISLTLSISIHLYLRPFSSEQQILLRSINSAHAKHDQLPSNWLSQVNYHHQHPYYKPFLALC